MKTLLKQRVLIACDDEFKSAVDKLEKYYEVRGMSATIRRAVILAARKLGKEVKNGNSEN